MYKIEPFTIKTTQLFQSNKKLENQKPLLSVLIITYNQENFIEECLNGVLMQICDFKVEIIIANDCSKDNTDEIISRILKEWGDNKIIKYLNREQNWGAMSNFIDAYNNCSGKYIALCEGDDYWTDPLKLQKQVDFLEKNDDCSACFHQVDCLIENEFNEDIVIENRYQKILDKNNIRAIDLLEQGNFIHTCSIVFRNKLIKMPFEASYSSVGDYILFILLGQKGRLKRIGEKMSVYRRGVGIYSTLSIFEMEKKILIYNICILSFINDEDEREVLLKKTLSLLEEITRNLNPINIGFTNNTTFINLLEILIVKFKKKLRRIFNSVFKIIKY